MGGKCIIRDEKTFKKIAKGARNTGNHEQEPGKKMWQMTAFENSYSVDGNDTPLKRNSKLKHVFVLLGCTILFCYFTLFIETLTFKSKFLLITFIACLLTKLMIKLFTYSTAFNMSAYCYIIFNFFPVQRLFIFK